MIKCKDCGMLGVRRPRTREIIEFRQEDNHHRYFSADGDLYDNCYICCADAIDFQKLGELAIYDDRECTEFQKRITGLSPREHIFMYQHQSLLALQQEVANQQREIAAMERRANTRQFWCGIAISVTTAFGTAATTVLLQSLLAK